eukprot:18787-Heterococcus_DN1.PRE.4
MTNNNTCFDLVLSLRTIVGAISSRACFNACLIESVIAVQHSLNCISMLARVPSVQHAFVRTATIAAQCENNKRAAN